MRRLSYYIGSIIFHILQRRLAMNKALELRSVAFEHCNAARELLLAENSKMFNDLIKLAETESVDSVKSYLRNIDMMQHDYRQYVSTGHADIDAVLQRYMLEVGMQGIDVAFNVDSLDLISDNVAMAIIYGLTCMFTIILGLAAGVIASFHITVKRDMFHISAETDNVQLYSLEIAF